MGRSGTVNCEASIEVDVSFAVEYDHDEGRSGGTTEDAVESYTDYDTTVTAVTVAGVHMSRDMKPAEALAAVLMLIDKIGDEAVDEDEVMRAIERDLEG